ncbi:MAG: flagellar motor protein MotB [Candidatus Sericytochromatia bacterium]|nr:flagellar motor protein MotB [Candidatus Sericytochromatia bacterium]
MAKEWFHGGDDGLQGGGETAGRERWLVTYADLITLLLVFFIILYAMSSRIEGEKFQQLATSLATSIKKATPKVSDKRAYQRDDSKQTRRFKATADAVLESLVRTDPKSDVKVDIDERGMVVSLIDTSFFEPGSAVIKPAGQRVLQKIAANFKGMKNDFRVEGHTDSIPIRTPRFPSNWELSAARATAVTRFLIQQAHVSSTRVSVAAFAEHHPVASNGTAEGRKRNRRVDIVILKEAGAAPIGAGLPMDPGSLGGKASPKPAKAEPTPKPRRGFANPFEGQ